MVEKYLYAMIIEAHGGREYFNICISSASNFLNNDYDISIFLEGAYIKNDVIHRERMDATRILYNSRR